MGHTKSGTNRDKDENGRLLQLTGVTKIFPGVTALDDVDFHVDRGELVALCGENGAGKSTLIKLLGGVHSPDGGTIRFDGEEIEFTTTQHSQDAGIAVIYQEFNLVPELTVAENIFIGREPRRLAGLLIDYPELNRRATDILKGLDSEIAPGAWVKDLSVAERQMVEIAKALSVEAKLIIMDEPTASLTDKEVRSLFSVVKKLRHDGVSIIYISHRLEEAFELSNRIAVLRDGKMIGARSTVDTTAEEIIEMMVGKVSIDYFANKTSTVHSEVVLDVRNYSVADAVDDVSFQLHKGEILGLAGIIGSGVQGLLHSLYGVRPNMAGEVLFEGTPVDIRSSKQAIRLGIGYVTDDRKETGIFPEMSLLENVTITVLKWLTRLRGFFVDDDQEEDRFDAIAKRLDIRFASKKQRVVYLSGGNQQKAVMGRTLLTDCKVLILLEPTRGIDVGAKAEIHKMIRELATGGMSVIFTSSELGELVNLPDRCLVFYRGRIVDEISRADMDEERLVAAQIGHSAQKQQTTKGQSE
jgi:ABC-type sugar transport system ATPase subunit